MKNIIVEGPGCPSKKKLVRELVNCTKWKIARCPANSSFKKFSDLLKEENTIFDGFFLKAHIRPILKHKVNNLTLLEYSKLCELVKSNKSVYIIFFPDTYKKSSLKEIELYHMYAVKFNEEHKYKKFYVLYENDWEEKIDDIIGEIL